MVTLTQPVIIVALICLVPWTVIYGLAVAGDSLYTWRSRRNPRQMQVALRQFEPVPDYLEASHDALLALNFDPIAVDETGIGKEWLYRHSEIPTLLAVLNADTANQTVVEFATRFTGLFVMTTSGSTEENQGETPGLIVNNIDAGITPALEFHLKQVEDEMTRSGEPQPLDTPDDYQAWMTAFRALIRQNSAARRWQLISGGLLVIATGIGLLGLSLMNSARLADVLMLVLAVGLWLVIALQIRWILRPPWEKAV